MKARFAHVNLVARDWRTLASFYQDVFGCVTVPPERHLRGEWLSRATGVADAALEGIHLRLPAGGDNGPTLELFQYSTVVQQPLAAANRQGFGHVAFEVDDVCGAVSMVLEHGGALIGDVVERPIEGAGTITFAYARDPEGNVIELQQWSGTHHT
jgi:catechol 2,3-dioxygenase-like lactoylglutathione lyase family enzyme